MKYLSIFLITLTIFFVGCGQSTEEEIRSRVLEAQIHLSHLKCDDALAALAGLNANTDALFVRTLASAYACKAGYTTPGLVTNDLGYIADPSELGGFTRFSTSNMDAVDATSFRYLQSAINTLLYAGGLPTTVNPTADRRAEKFDSNEAGDINQLLFFLVMAQLGNYLKFYGDGDALGNKGGCLLDYENLAGDVVDLYTFIATIGGATCDPTTDDGNPLLGVAGTLNVERVCQGVVLTNTLFDTFTQVVTGLTGPDYAFIQDVLDQLLLAKTAFIANDPAGIDIATVQSQTLCEQYSAATDDHIEFFFGFYIESLYR